MAGHEATQGWAKKLAERSPRLHGLSVIGFGAALYGLLSVIRRTGYSLPFAEAFAWVMIGAGSWICATGYSFATSPEKLPAWWRPGFFVAVLLGGLVGFFIRR